MAPCAVGKSLDTMALTARPPDARPGEHGLGHHRAAQQERRLQADQRDHGISALRSAWWTITTVSRRPLGARRAHEVCAQHLEHGGARQPRSGRSARAQRERRQHQAGQAAIHTGPVRPVNGSSAHWKPTYWIRSGR